MKRRRTKSTLSKDNWQTPECVLDCVRRMARSGEIALDPATTDDNPTEAVELFTPRENGLERQWCGPKGTVYVNPPYSQSRQWVEKMVLEAEHGVEIVSLLGCSTGSRWFQPIFKTATALCFVRGRLRFKEAPGPANFDSVLVYWGRRPNEFKAAMTRLGNVVWP